VTDVLVLSPAYEPIRTVSIKRAVILLLQEKAELVEATEQTLRAQGLALPQPLVIRLVRFVRVNRARRLPCSRRLVLTRDRDTCQYCGAQPGRARLTIDHVIPKTQGGQTAWDNVVAACEGCNHRKGGRTPEQARMPLRSTPRQPQYAALVLLGDLERKPEWRKYVYA
jgi:5-methylcytosine-specific restriction endonuclease McrA